MMSDWIYAARDVPFDIDVTAYSRRNEDYFHEVVSLETSQQLAVMTLKPTEETNYRSAKSHVFIRIESGSAEVRTHYNRQRVMYDLKKDGVFMIDAGRSFSIRNPSETDKLRLSILYQSLEFQPGTVYKTKEEQEKKEVDTREWCVIS